ncbi:MAG: hypothetical protein ACYCY6_02200 [Minisyncoccota bacterium]
MIFWRGKQISKNVLVVDIASDSTSAALVKTHQGRVPEVLAKVRTPFTLENKIEGGMMGRAMISSLHTTLSSISKGLPSLVNGLDKGVMTLSAPWAESHMKTVVVAKDEGFIFDSSMLHVLLRDEEKKFSSSLKESYNEESEIFEVALTSLHLNGYETPVPVNEKVKRVEVNFITSATTKDLLEMIENEITKNVGLKNGVVMHSFMFSLYKVLSHSFHNLHTALLLSMTSETTDVLLLRHGNSAVSNSIPFGSSSIAVSLAKKLNIPNEVASSYLSLYGERLLDTDTSSVVEGVIVSAGQLWKAEWGKNNSDIESGDEAPYSIFLVAPNGNDKLMKLFFEKVFPKRNIILIGDTNNFTKELVKNSTNERIDEKMIILASFSNLLK